jgi:predicted acetyltransferase
MEFRAPHADEYDALDAVLGPALHFPGGTMRDWMETLGMQNMRAVLHDGRIVAGLGAFPCGHWLGGRVVDAAAVTAVGVAPDARAGGVGSWMLRQSLSELRAAGIPLASLYPATLAFYRRAGYERAASRIGYELPLALIQPGDQSRAAELRPFEPDDAEVRQLYEWRARRTAGNMQRPEWLWQFRLAPRERKVFRFLVLRAGQPEGYVAFAVGGRSDPLAVLDCVTLTPEAGRRVLALLADYSSVLDSAVWAGGPNDALLHLLRENLVGGSRLRVTTKYSYDLMLRIVDPVAAIEARGFPAGLRATLQINLADDVLAENAGRYTIEVEGGRAAVSRGGAGRIALGMRELAAIYTGFMAPQELRAIGRIAGPDDDMGLMGAVFGGVRPWVADMF